jgi:large subunit ribosomal protein L9
MALVKVILREDIQRLGDAGEVVSVRPGFARNFLLPQGKAILATESSMKALEHHQRVIAEKIAREKKTLEGEKGRIEAIALEIAVQVGEEGKLFGSVTAAQIAELLEAKGVSVDRRKIELAEPIKEVGEHRVPLRLHRDVVATLRLNVRAAE